MLVPFYIDVFKYDLSDNENGITQYCVGKRWVDVSVTTCYKNSAPLSEKPIITKEASFNKKIYCILKNFPLSEFESGLGSWNY